MPKLEVQTKDLKLSNVLVKSIESEELNQLDRVVELMDSYIKSKGGQPIGPLIHYILADIKEDGDLKATVKCMRQSNNFINKTEAPYYMHSVLKVPNCLYLRFVGHQDDIHFGYDKMRLYAHEEGIKLKGDSYAVYVDQQSDVLTVDLFMEKKDD